MSKRKLLNKKIWLWVGIGVVILALLLTGYYIFSRNRNHDITTADMNNLGIERALEFGESLTNYPIIWVQGQNVGSMTSTQRREFLQAEIEAYGSREVVATYEDRNLTTNLGNLGLTLEDDIDYILEQLDTLQQDLILEQSVTGSRVPFMGQYDLAYTYSEALVEEWVQSIANQLYVSVVEPNLTRSGGSFNVTPGRAGVSAEVERLSKDLHQELQNLEQANFNVDVNVEYTSPNRSQSLLESVNTIVASANSQFPTSDAERTHNVKLAAQQVNGTLLMPGDEFSFGAKVEPVTFAGGYKAATIFANGEQAEGVGGGICQISSTLYWAQLRAGILPTQRRAHSLPVGYVPLGLDATYATNAIDYRFVNTLDYPIYISAHINGNTLTVDLWSNAKALNGYTYEPRYTQTENNSQSQTWATYLRTYHSGSLVNESFLHNSTYRHPQN